MDFRTQACLVVFSLHPLALLSAMLVLVSFSAQSPLLLEARWLQLLQPLSSWILTQGRVWESHYRKFHKSLLMSCWLQLGYIPLPKPNHRGQRIWCADCFGPGASLKWHRWIIGNEWNGTTKISPVTRRREIVAREENKTCWGNYTWGGEDVATFPG